MSPRAWSVTLMAAILLAAAAVPSAAVAQTPDQTINAQQDPQGAAAALNSACADNIKNCKLADISVTNGYNAPEILGDVVYNCAPPGGPNAYTATSVTDTRGETTSLTESLSVTLQGGLIGIASASAEFKVFSSQSDSWTASVTSQTTITVPPGYKGFTTTEVLSANATASYNVTDGINLIKVTGVNLSFAGYQDPQSNGNDARVIYNTLTVPIDPLFPVDRFDPLGPYQDLAPCTAVSDAPDTTVVNSSVGGVQQKRRTGRFEFTLCKPGGRCVHHSLRGSPPAKMRRATAKLTRRGRTYAAGTDIRGRIRLTERRKITAGTYRLTIAKKPKRFRERRYGGRLAEQHVTTRIPIKVCGNSPSTGLLFGKSCTNAKQ